MIPIVIVIVLAALLVYREVAARRRERRLLAEMETLRGHLNDNDRLVNVGQLVSGLAQDLKSPLQGMLGSAEVLAASDPSNAGAAVELREIRDNVTRAAGIVRNLLAFTETTSLDRRWHDVNELVRRSIPHHRPANGADRITFAGGARLPLAYIDGRQIEKVLATLLDRSANTGRHHSGDVAVSTKKGATDDRLVIVIDDEAPADDEAAWSGDLDACRRVLHAHGGSLEVERQGAGGLRFLLELPFTEIGENQAT